jgi:carbamoyl-phosphate synthase large subunit
VVVIEMNPRVSRSSALASKATGFPIAKVAALLSVGFTLDELQNDITNGLTPASFEPSIDYIVTKIPKFAFEKFPQANDRLTTQMKSVGEVMGIGRTFQESLQKALQSLEEDLNGFESILDDTSNQNETLRYQLTFPGSRRILYVGDAIRLGWDADQLNQLTGIDFWFLQQIIDLVDEENILQDMKLQEIDFHKMLNLKQKGFADHRIAKLTKSTAQDVRDLRKKLGVMPSFKRVDTCAAEFATETAYMYSTYEGECESRPTNNKKVIVLGSGPNRIGQGIEFDYCCVHASFALQEEGYESIMINCNPETVSTDYDTSNRLYFEPITEEKVLDIIDLERPQGVIIQFGGQTPLKLSETLLSNNVTILGTDVDAIDRSEDRERFQSLAHQLNLKQPPNSTVKNLGEALQMSEEIGFPIVVRPSYVLGGRAMELVHTQVELEKYLKEAVEVSDQKPILLDGYLTDAIEVDVDVISDGSDIEIGGILQHIEQAGIHSGDSACSLPPYSLSKKVIQEIESQAKKIAKELNVVGLMNIQFAVQDEDVFIIEVNPRASRTVPFISKCIGESLVKSATKTMVGKTLKDTGFSNELPMNYFFVKEAVLPFDKFPAVDPILGPEMKSTGEVMGIGSSFGEAYAKAQRAANKVFPESGLAFISVKESDKKYLPNLIPMLVEHGFSLIATKGTAHSIKALGYDAQIINKVTEGRPHIVDELLNNRVNLLINTTEGRQSIEDSASIRRTALQNKLFCVTTIFGAFALLEAMSTNSDNWIYNSLQEIN